MLSLHKTKTFCNCIFFFTRWSWQRNDKTKERPHVFFVEWIQAFALYFRDRTKKHFLLLKTSCSVHSMWRDICGRKKSNSRIQGKKIKKQKLGRQKKIRKTAFDYFSKDIIESNFFRLQQSFSDFNYTCFLSTFVWMTVWTAYRMGVSDAYRSWLCYTQNIQNSIYLFVK